MINIIARNFAIATIVLIGFRADAANMQPAYKVTYRNAESMYCLGGPTTLTYLCTRVDEKITYNVGDNVELEWTGSPFYDYTGLNNKDIELGIEVYGKMNCKLYADKTSVIASCTVVTPRESNDAYYIAGRLSAGSVQPSAYAISYCSNTGTQTCILPEEPLAMRATKDGRVIKTSRASIAPKIALVLDNSLSIDTRPGNITIQGKIGVTSTHELETTVKSTALPRDLVITYHAETHNPSLMLKFDNGQTQKTTYLVATSETTSLRETLFVQGSSGGTYTGVVNITVSTP